MSLLTSLLSSCVVQAGILLATLAFVVRLYFKSKYNYFKKRNIPYLEPSIPFGNCQDAFLLKRSLFDAFMQLYKQGDGMPYFGFFNTVSPSVMIRDPELIQNVMIKDFSYFTDRGLTPDLEVNPLDQNLVIMRGAEWKALRNKMSPVFTSGKLKAMVPIIDQVALILQKNAMTQKTDVDLREWVGRYTTDVIVNTAFGVESDAITNPNSQFYLVSKKIFDISVARLIARFASIFAKKFASVKTFSQEVEDFFMNLIKTTMAQRENTNTKRNDFIQMLMELKHKGKVECDPKDLEREHNTAGATESIPEAHIEITDYLLGAQSFVFFLGGFDPTANCIAFTIYLLSKHQSKQEKAREEILSVLASHGGELTYDAIRDMKYLNACVQEALRVLPVAPLVIRETTRDYTLNDGVVFEKGTMIILPSKALQVDPAYWTDPDTYMPERFLQENWKPVPGTYFPFGDGPRICIGERFALLTVKLALARLLQTHRLVASPKNQEPLRASLNLATLLMQGGLWVRLQPLENKA